MVANKSGITQLSLFKSEEDESRVDNFITPFGAVVAKKWTTKRLSRGANWSQVSAAESGLSHERSCVCNSVLPSSATVQPLTEHGTFNVFADNLCILGCASAAVCRVLCSAAPQGKLPDEHGPFTGI